MTKPPNEVKQRLSAETNLIAATALEEAYCRLRCTCFDPSFQVSRAIVPDIEAH